MLSSNILALALFVTTAFAVPSSRERYAARVARRAAGDHLHVSRPSIVNGTDISYTTNWAGAVLNDAANTWTSVVGTFTVPSPRVPAGGSGSSAAAVWVGIDGASCQTAILLTGIDMSVGANGAPSYSAWWDWWPDSQGGFAGAFDIAPGDAVTALVEARSATSGTATLVNARTGQSVTQAITSTTALCGQDAEWIVEAFDAGGQMVPFADFGTVTFSGVAAGGVLGVVGPGNANIYEIVQGGAVVTDVTVGVDSVVVSYVGS
ncbi:peptidase G1 family domain-containing protein [Phanerochaete sordida]|uniref:Peptidase G1 family domain-containing protein n=1 Tax=Phanerochaete sordida TaxID=48140 RepID=A0A9P3LLJ1_9APHY|nr:peptidase G1 family domain-containing protein [Phanerochaete sordida]